MPTEPIAKYTMVPEVERKDGGWVVLHYRGSGLMPSHFTTEEEARRQAKKMAEKIGTSNEFALVVSVSEAYFPK
jgi:hypothetical protein